MYHVFKGNFIHTLFLLASHILIIILILVGAVAVTTGGSSSPGTAYLQSSSPNAGGFGLSGGKIWTIHIGHDFGAHEYM